MISVAYDPDSDMDDSKYTRCYWVGDCITECSHIVSIEADGDELNEVLGQLGNIPYSKSEPVQRWFGDMAKFIGYNVRLDKPQHGKFRAKSTRASRREQE